MEDEDMVRVNSRREQMAREEDDKYPYEGGYPTGADDELADEEAGEEPKPTEPNRFAYAVEWETGDVYAIPAWDGSLKKIQVGPGHINNTYLPSFEEDVRKARRAMGYAVAKADSINELAGEVHDANKNWWRDPQTGEPIERNKGEMLALIISEISECLEGERKGCMDDHLPHREMAEVELADAMIRIFDYAAGHGYDLGGAFVEKMDYNRTRKDHTAEERVKTGGKKF